MIAEQLDGYIRARAEEKAQEILNDKSGEQRKRLVRVGWHGADMPSLYQLRILVQAFIISERSRPV